MNEMLKKFFRDITMGASVKEGSKRRNRKVKCVDCGKMVSKSKVVVVEELGYVCEHCLNNEEKYRKCEECGEYLPADDCFYSDECAVCFDCFSSIPDDDPGAKVLWCSECYDMFKASDDGWYQVGDKILCEDCFDNLRIMRRPRDNPDYIFNTVENENVCKNTLFYGIEIEADYFDCEDRKPCLGELYALDPQRKMFWISKDDSLNAGFEIDLHPMTYDYFMKVFPLDRICNIVCNYDGKADDADTCGLHIHVSKKSLGESEPEIQSTICKMLFLMERSWKEWLIFSRRKNDKQIHGYCDHNPINYDEISNSEARTKKLADSRELGRYQAINVTNENTVEFRIFQGSIRPYVIKAAVQLVKNFVEICKMTPIEEIQGVKFSDYAKGYPELDRFVEEIGFC